MGILYDKKRLSNPRMKRLAHEHELLHDFCERSDLVSYEIRKKHHRLVPEEYIIHYKLKSIVSIDAHRNPVYGSQHAVEVVFPAGFPLADAPKCTMVTPIWHPNIRSTGNSAYIGRICINAKALGFWFTLDMLAERIGEMLQYKNYHAENIAPHPEDEVVARWVREYAEPNGIVNKEKGIYIDDTSLITPYRERKPKEEDNNKGKKPKIRIEKVRKNTTPLINPQPFKPKSKRRITVKRRNFD